jgi:hypothetical protein
MAILAKFNHINTGTDPGFQVRGGAHLKKLRRAEGGANIFGVFRVKKNHDFIFQGWIPYNWKKIRFFGVKS